MLGLAVLLLAACSSANPGLIPADNAEPLQVDFETVAADAQNGNGSCGETAAAIRKTEQDFSELPASVASNLRNTLSSGIANLSSRALILCAKPIAQTTTTTTQTSATVTTTIFTTSETTTTETTSVSTPTTSSPGGGTPAPGTGEAAPGAGAGAGGTPGAGAGGAPAVQEGLK